MVKTRYSVVVVSPQTSFVGSPHLTQDLESCGYIVLNRFVYIVVVLPMFEFGSTVVVNVAVLPAMNSHANPGLSEQGL